MSNVQFTNLPAALAVTDSDIIAIVQNNTSKRATIQQIKNISGGSVTSVSGQGTVNGITLTGTVTNSGYLTLGGKFTQIAYSVTTQSSPWAWNSDNYDIFAITALANNLTINADSGSPTNGQKATFRIRDNGTARTLSWTTGTAKSFRAIGVTLPTTTVANKTVYIGCLYNSVDNRWDVVAIAQEA